MASEKEELDEGRAQLKSDKAKLAERRQKIEEVIKKKADKQGQDKYKEFVGKWGLLTYILASFSLISVVSFASCTPFSEQLNRVLNGLSENIDNLLQWQKGIALKAAGASWINGSYNHATYYIVLIILVIIAMAIAVMLMFLAIVWWWPQKNWLDLIVPLGLLICFIYGSFKLQTACEWYIASTCAFWGIKAFISNGKKD